MIQVAHSMNNSTNQASDHANGRSRLDASQPPLAADVDVREYRLFQSLDIAGQGEVPLDTLLDALRAAGLDRNDPRLREAIKHLAGRPSGSALTFPQFSDAIRPNILLIEQALQGNLVVPDFRAFCGEVTRIYDQTRDIRSGEVARYIPQLARVDPELYGIAVCTVDGQRFAVGDARSDFCVQSCCKPVAYCLALEEHGDEHVHRYVGREPSGRIFNELALGDGGRPHNPMINAGAIMCTSMIKPHSDQGDRFDYVLDRWSALCGGEKAGFCNPVYQSERQSADRNFALGYYMKEHDAFPESTDLLETLDFYFQCCSIEVNAVMMSNLAATLANGGVCPLSGERIFTTKNVQHCLSLMCSCGMYDFSGEFAFAVGLPAKSGVGGAILVVIPNVLGLCVWSPRLDSHGNSTRGIAFCKELVKTFNIHNFDNLTLESDKIDPRVDRIQTKAENVGEMIWAASKGDMGALHRLVVRGFDQDTADYDRRTPLHLAAAEGRKHVVRYLIDNGADVNPRDRWGGTPLDDALRHGHATVAELLKRHGGTGGETDVAEQLVVDDAALAQLTREVSHPIVQLIYAASEGNLDAVRRLVARGIDLAGADYDLRTPLHLAAAEGHHAIVRYFIDQSVELSPRDRWGNTPLDDARRHAQQQVVELLESATEPSHTPENRTEHRGGKTAARSRRTRMTYSDASDDSTTSTSSGKTSEDVSAGGRDGCSQSSPISESCSRKRRKSQK